MPPTIKGLDVSLFSTKFEKFKIAAWLVILLFVCCLTAAPAAAQVVVVVNGSPITVLDIEQRSKLMAAAAHHAPSRQEAINELIEDRLKITYAKRYSFEVSDSDVDNSFANMAKRQHVTPQQFEQELAHSGIAPNALKARLRAEITWSQLVRGRYSSSLQVGDAEIKDALQARNVSDKDEVSHVYTLYPITVVVQRGAGKDSSIEAKRQMAENIRGRFQNCNTGLSLARSIRDVAVGEPVNLNSAELPVQMRELVGGMQIGQLTEPEVTPQGFQMYALCAKKESSTDSAVKHEVREELYNKRFTTEAKKFLDEIRKSAMIEYK
jgi:peptidyl-prolyl cis-trans isomerase SurA